MKPSSPLFMGELEWLNDLENPLPPTSDEMAEKILRGLVGGSPEFVKVALVGTYQCHRGLGDNIDQAFRKAIDALGARL